MINSQLEIKEIPYGGFRTSIPATTVPHLSATTSPPVEFATYMKGSVVYLGQTTERGDEMVVMLTTEQAHIVRDLLDRALKRAGPPHA